MLLPSPSSPEPQSAPAAVPRWWGWLGALVAALACLGVFGLYLAPEFMVTLADQVWSCF